MSLFQRILDSFLHGPIYVMLIGFVFFTIGAGMTYHEYNLARNGVQAQGEVLSLASVCDDDGCTYAPIVQFQSKDGRIITIESSYSSSPPAYDVGETVTVIYPPDKPEKADIKGAGKVFRYIFIGIGGIIMLFGLVMLGRNFKYTYKSG